MYLSYFKDESQILTDKLARLHTTLAREHKSMQHFTLKIPCQTMLLTDKEEMSVRPTVSEAYLCRL